MVENQKILRLLAALLEATLQGRLQWAEGDSPKAFQLETRHATVSLEEEYPEASRSNFCITLRDQAGKTIEVEFVDPTDGEQYETVRRLYELARKSASRVDEVIDKMIAEVTAPKG